VQRAAIEVEEDATAVLAIDEEVVVFALNGIYCRPGISYSVLVGVMQ